MSYLSSLSSESKQLFRVLRSDGGNIFDGGIMELRNFRGDSNDIGTFISFAPVGNRCQPGRVGFNQQMRGINFLNGLSKIRILKGDDTIDPNFKSHFNNLFGLFKITGETVKNPF